MVKISRKKLKKKHSQRFFFGNSLGRKIKLYFRKTFSNIFITVTDLRNKVIYSISAGMCAEKNNKRSKTAPFIIESMATAIIKTLEKFKVKKIQLIIKSSLRIHLRILVYRLLRANYAINSILDRRIAAHNGVRGRAIKRR